MILSKNPHIITHWPGAKLVTQQEREQQRAREQEQARGSKRGDIELFRQLLHGQTNSYGYGCSGGDCWGLAD